MDMEIITEGMSEEEKQFLDKILNFKVNNVSGYDILKSFFELEKVRNNNRLDECNNDNIMIEGQLLIDKEEKRIDILSELEKWYYMYNNYNENTKFYFMNFELIDGYIRYSNLYKYVEKESKKNHINLNTISFVNKFVNFILDKYYVYSYSQNLICTDVFDIIYYLFNVLKFTEKDFFTNLSQFCISKNGMSGIRVFKFLYYEFQNNYTIDEIYNIFVKWVNDEIHIFDLEDIKTYINNTILDNNSYKQKIKNVLHKYQHEKNTIKLISKKMYLTSLNLTVLFDKIIDDIKM